MQNTNSLANVVDTFHKLYLNQSKIDSLEKENDLYHNQAQQWLDVCIRKIKKTLRYLFASHMPLLSYNENFDKHFIQIWGLFLNHSSFRRKIMCTLKDGTKIDLLKKIPTRWLWEDFEDELKKGTKRMYEQYKKSNFA